MVDVAAKPETAREAVASAVIRMARETLAVVESSGRGAPGPRDKGDVFATARLAALTAMKRTSEIIPLCHPIRLTGGGVDIEADLSLPGIRIRVTARAFDRTGVEMEAMFGASAAALTVYDMVKGLERGVEIVSVRLDEKRGGRTGVWQRRPEQGKAKSGRRRAGPNGKAQRRKPAAAGLTPTAAPRTGARGKRRAGRPHRTDRR